MFMAPQPQAHRARRITRLLRALPVSVGPDMRLNRIIGTETLLQIDPFLQLDEVRADKAHRPLPAFPPQPLRGFDILTYMTAGWVHHVNSRGVANDIGPSQAQWVTAGKGVIQSETPIADNGHLHGFQLWLNLPEAEKDREPELRRIPAEDIPAMIFATGEIRLLAGRYRGLMGPVSTASQPFIADVVLNNEGDIALAIPEDHQGFIYVYEGGVAVEQTLVNPGQIGVLDVGTVLNLTAGAYGARVLVATARPLNEPIVRHGPFIMTSQQAIKAAFDDYRNGLFGSL